MSHGYFRSYLGRLSEYESKLCQDCKIKQTSKHLILNCKKYSQIKNQLFKKKNLNQTFFKILFNSKKGINSLFEYFKKTDIATKKWLENN